MGLLHSLQDTDWNVTISNCLWQGVQPSWGTRAQGSVKEVSSHRKLQLTELEELCNDAYDSARIYKEKTGIS